MRRGGLISQNRKWLTAMCVRGGEMEVDSIWWVDVWWVDAQLARCFDLCVSVVLAARCNGMKINTPRRNEWLRIGRCP